MDASVTELLTYAQRPATAWKPVSHSASLAVTVYRATDEKWCYKAVTHVASGVSAQAAFETVSKPELWNSWHTESRLVDNISESSSHTYSVFGGIPGTSTKDVSLLETRHAVEDSLILAARSIESDKVPPVQGRQRISIPLTGWLIRERADEKGLELVHIFKVHNPHDLLPRILLPKRYLPKHLADCLYKVTVHLSPAGTNHKAGSIRSFNVKKRQSLLSRSRRSVSVLTTYSTTEPTPPLPAYLAQSINGKDGTIIANGATDKEEEQKAVSPDEEAAGTTPSVAAAAATEIVPPTATGKPCLPNFASSECCLPEKHEAMDKLLSQPATSWTRATKDGALIIHTQSSGDRLIVKLESTVKTTLSTEDVLSLIVETVPRQHWDIQFRNSLDRVEYMNGIYPNISDYHYAVKRSVRRSRPSSRTANISVVSTSSTDSKPIDNPAFPTSILSPIDVWGWHIDKAHQHHLKLTHVMSLALPPPRDGYPSFAPRDALQRAFAMNVAVSFENLMGYISSGPKILPYLSRMSAGPWALSNTLSKREGSIQMDFTRDTSEQAEKETQVAWLCFPKHAYPRGIAISQSSEGQGLTLSRIAQFPDMVQLAFPPLPSSAITLVIDPLTDDNTSDEPKVVVDGQVLTAVIDAPTLGGASGAVQDKDATGTGVGAAAGVAGVAGLAAAGTGMRAAANDDDDEEKEESKDPSETEDDPPMVDSSELQDAWAPIIVKQDSGVHPEMYAQQIAAMVVMMALSFALGRAWH